VFAESSNFKFFTDNSNMSCFHHTARSSLINMCIHHDSSKYRRDKTRYQTRKIYERNTERKRKVTTDETSKQVKKERCQKEKEKRRTRNVR